MYAAECCMHTVAHSNQLFHTDGTDTAETGQFLICDIWTMQVACTLHTVHKIE